jgi:hypothetical protein
MTWAVFYSLYPLTGSQHLTVFSPVVMRYVVGMDQSKHIISINTYPNADIFDASDITVVEDFRKIQYSIAPWPRPTCMAGVQRAALQKYYSDNSVFQASRALPPGRRPLRAGGRGVGSMSRRPGQANTPSP